MVNKMSANGKRLIKIADMKLYELDVQRATLLDLQTQLIQRGA